MARTPWLLAAVLDSGSGERNGVRTQLNLNLNDATRAALRIRANEAVDISTGHVIRQDIVEEAQKNYLQMGRT